MSLSLRGALRGSLVVQQRGLRGTKNHTMLALSLRRRGAAWLAQLVPAHSCGLLLGCGLSSSGRANAGQRALACAAAEPTAADTSAAATAESGMGGAEPAAKGRGRPTNAGPTVLLVESPAKARKIQGFLGPNYTVLASYGHIRDLPATRGSVEPEVGFAMKWEVPHVAEERLPPIVGAVRTASRLLLATDPDREGEAISWHLLQELRARKAVHATVPTQRITFTEVTKRAVEEALQQPREISEPLVHAYMARRALDYLFGFHLSPLLWRKVPGAQSAGRVQSVALRLVCDREAAIAAFQQQQYYTVEAALQLPGGALEARLAFVDGAPPPQPGFADQEQADAVAARVAAAQFNMQEATRREQQRQPPPPFTTSTLQQEANNRLGLSASHTMQLAQQLYEGGHITYMRTDGVNLSPAAIVELREAVVAEHGAEYMPPEARVYKTKSKNVQEAHEAIRPTEPLLTAEQLAAQGVVQLAAKLYGLIRGRALACQMSSARITQVAANLASSDGTLQLRATTSAVSFPGYLAAYFDAAAVPSAAAANGVEAGEDAVLSEDEEGEDSGGATPAKKRAQQEAARAAAAEALTAIQQGQLVAVSDAAASGHKTRPPARYTEGSLVKHLEELGVGRPSTYAPTLNVLQARGYVRKEGRAMHAEALGRVLSAFLEAYFPRYVDYGFTSGLEEQLDEVSGGSINWKDVLDDFWSPFSDSLGEVAGVAVTDVIDRLNKSVGDQLIGKDRSCPKCGGLLSLKFTSKRKAPPFVGCSQYPACTYSRPIDASWVPEDVLSDASSTDEGVEEESGATTAADGPPNTAAPSRYEAVQAEKAVALAGLSGYARLLGNDPDTGLPVFVRAGLYGPYVQRGISPDDGIYFRRQALPRRAMHRVVTLQIALSMLSLPKDLGPNPATGESVLVSMGKFGPFIRCGALSRAVPKDYDPLKMTLADSLQLLASKSNYATTRTARKAALADAAATSEAAANGEEGDATEKKRRGRPRSKRLARKTGAAGAAAQAAKGGDLVPHGDGGIAVQWARQARTKARAALDAAAEVEVKQLQAALAVQDGTQAADQKRARKARGITGYNMFYRCMVAEANRTGNKWWGEQLMTTAVAAGWKALPPEERRVYEDKAAEARMELKAYASNLLPMGTALASLAPARRAKLEADLALQQVEMESRLSKSQKKRWLLPRPRTAYNLFTKFHLLLAKEELGPRATGADIMLRLAEMWRGATVLQKVKFKLQAEEETKAYREAKAALTQKQQAATAEALAAGKDPVAAARAGMLAGQALVEDFLRQRQRCMLQVSTTKAGNRDA